MTVLGSKTTTTTATTTKYTHVVIQAQAFRRKPKKLRLFSHNKKLKTLTEVKNTKNDLIANSICDKILSENTSSNVNYRN